MKKTIKERFEEVEEPYKSQLIANTTDKALLKLSPDLEEAVLGAFVWAESPERYTYWENYYDSLKDNTTNENN